MWVAGNEPTPVFRHTPSVAGPFEVTTLEWRPETNDYGCDAACRPPVDGRPVAGSSYRSGARERRVVFRRPRTFATPSKYVSGKPARQSSGSHGS